MVNIEAVVVAALRAGAVAGGRVYVDVPANAAYPCGRVTRVGGGMSRPFWLDRALLQVEFWGSAGPSGTGEAFDAAAAAIECLGHLPAAQPDGVVGSVIVDSVGNVYDTTFVPARARRIITCTVVCHPTPVPTP